MEVGTITMKYNEKAEEYINQIPMWAKEKNSLKDIRDFLYEMGEPDERMKIFHVAGTNGKGSVCAFLQSALLNAGYKVGTFTSPHLIETRERFFLQGKMAPENAFEESYETIRALSELMMKRGYCHPTYFEFLFYMALDLFEKADMEIVILETGMGGRLDTTNVIRHPVVSVITSISLDHMEYLGDTIEKIASEKAGIIKPGIPVVFDSNDRKVVPVIRQKAEEMGAPVYEVDRQGYEITKYENKGYRARFIKYEGSSFEVTIPSPAEYQVMNALICYKALEAAGFVTDEEKSLLMKEGLSQMYWPARMEEVLPGVFLDGAHNPGGISAFVQAANNLCKEKNKRAYLLFSAVLEKDHDRMIKEIGAVLPLDGVIVTHIDSKRGLEAEVMFREFKRACECRVEMLQTVKEAILHMLQKRDEDHLLFCVGSLYLMGEIKEVLRRNEYDRF